ncbi:MAG TPA: carboxypeptidase-like regulatory domain-containing protein [Fermentimonas sp.]|nr:carboxypeptidase-like regulatory domain-containing protein [Fermentimonas sp.]
MKTVLVIGISLLMTTSAFTNSNISNNKEVKKSNETELVANVASRESLQLTGVVVDKKNNETLAGASILVDGRKFYSDLDGKFSVNDVKPGKYEMVVELISYEPISMQVDLSKNQSLNINLNQK